MLMFVVTACQSPENTPEASPTETTITAIPIQALLTARPQRTSVPASSGTAVGVDSSAGTVPTITQLPPPTPVPGPTNTATPVPEAVFHTIATGDTFSSIAEEYGVPIDSLVYANGYNSLADVSLVVGEPIQIPYCEVHQVVSGNTMSSIAQVCGITMDELIIANVDSLAAVGSLEGIPLGFTLLIPEESQTPEDLDCGAEPPREQVIEYTPGPGEGPFCLGQKFGVSASAIIQSNVDRLIENTYGEIPLLVPPIDGTLYIVAAEDVARNASLADLAAWYDVEEEAITDWNGNLVSDPLAEGQQLFIRGANLFFGPYQPSPPTE
jgi:LysM repeat protein